MVPCDRKGDATAPGTARIPDSLRCARYAPPMDVPPESTPPGSPASRVPDTPRAWALRPARPADAPAIARVHAASWRETYGRFVDDPDTNP